MDQQPNATVRRPTSNRAGYAQAVRVTWIGIAVMTALAAVKITAGLLTGSTALMADGVESLGDMCVSLAAVIGLRWAATPADERHPYGHGKAEVLTAVMIGGVMTVLAVGMAARAIWQIAHRSELATPHWAALAFLGLACVVGEALYRYKMWQAKRLTSAALRAEAYDHRKDELSSLLALLAVAGAVGLSRWYGPRFAWLDPVGGLITCLFIGWMVVRIVIDVTPQLMDEAVSGPMLAEIRRIAAETPGALGTEKLIARRSGLSVLVELHVEVDPALRVAEAHEIATEVRDRVVARIDAISEVLVHVEPYYRGDHVNPANETANGGC